MNFKFALLAAASVCSFGAQATTTDWGAHGPLELAAAVTPVGTFQDGYLFSLPSAYDLFTTSVSNNLTHILGIEGGTVALFKEAGAVDSALGSFAFDGTSGNSTHAYGTLAAGDYYYLVSGTGTGLAGGFYTISSSTATAVPEPDTYALLLAGLGVVGFLAHRSRR
jgi:hypothetical protein